MDTEWEKANITYAIDLGPELTAEEFRRVADLVGGFRRGERPRKFVECKVIAPKAIPNMQSKA